MAGSLYSLPKMNITQAIMLLHHKTSLQSSTTDQTTVWANLDGVWAKDEKIGYKMINARAETLSEKPSFRKPLVSKRCIIPADSFYEWKRLDPKTKIPMRIKLKSSNLFAFAGLYEKWNTPQGNPLYTCTIITTKPNELMEDIHDRMPVILTDENEKEWLNPKNTDLDYLQSLLQPYDPNDMKAYQVSSLVNSPKNNSPELIESH
ncbi:SOS response-associated peptidase [Bacillus inaquosorum]|uniref:SOS response-associated peptidase n=1 Tax=Bacillus inaquosorum TaxID=483913 RepID=UPI00398F96DC